MMPSAIHLIIHTSRNFGSEWKISKRSERTETPWILNINLKPFSFVQLDNSRAVNQPRWTPSKKENQLRIPPVRTHEKSEFIDNDDVAVKGKTKKISTTGSKGKKMERMNCHLRVGHFVARGKKNWMIEVTQGTVEGREHQVKQKSSICLFVWKKKKNSSKVALDICIKLLLPFAELVDATVCVQLGAIPAWLVDAGVSWTNKSTKNRNKTHQ